MDSKENQQYWNNIYTKNNPNEVSWFQQEPFISLQLIKRVSNNTARILDVGGGASVLTDYLLKSNFTNIGVLDISDKAMDHAKKRLAEQAGKVEWYVKDITDFVSSHPYDIWHDRAVFHFLTNSKSRALYIKTLKNTLNPGGYAIIATFAKEGPTQCSGLDIVQYDNSSIQHELGDDFILIDSQSDIHITPKNREQHFNYFLFKRLG